MGDSIAKRDTHEIWLWCGPAEIFNGLVMDRRRFTVHVPESPDGLTAEEVDQLALDLIVATCRTGVEFRRLIKRAESTLVNLTGDPADE